MKHTALVVNHYTFSHRCTFIISDGISYFYCIVLYMQYTEWSITSVSYSLAHWPRTMHCTQCSNKTVTLFNIALNCCEVRVSLSLALSLLFFSLVFIYLFFSRYYLLPQSCPCFFFLDCTSFMQSVRSAKRIPAPSTESEEQKHH